MTSTSIAFAAQLCAAEGNHEVLAGVLALVVGLPVQVLVLEEQHRVVRTNRRPQQTGRVHGVRRIHDADPRAVHEDALARLAVVRPAAAQVAANRHANDHRARPPVARSVPHHGQLVAHLHHRRPDVVEELDFHHRLQMPRGHPDRAADDARFGKRRIEHPIVSEPPLQAVRHLEDAALARHERRRGLPAHIRDVFPEHDDARVARHLVGERPVDGGDHRFRLAFGPGGRVERGRGRIDVRRVEPLVHRRSGRPFRGQGRQCRLVHFAVDVGGHRGELLVAEQGVGLQELGEAPNRIARRFGLTLGRGLVQAARRLKTSASTGRMTRACTKAGPLRART